MTLAEYAVWLESQENRALAHSIDAATSKTIAYLDGKSDAFKAARFKLIDVMHPATPDKPA